MAGMNQRYKMARRAAGSKYEGYTVITRSVKPPKKIDKKLKAKLKKDGFIDFSEVLGLENKRKDDK